MSWIDLLAVALIASLTALGAQRRLIGLVVGVGGALALRPLLLLAQWNVWVALAASLAAGLLLGLLGRNGLPDGRAGAIWRSGLGAVGGLALGLTLVLSVATSLPIQRSPFDPNQLYYPPRNLPSVVQSAVLESYTLGVGRDVLLYPLLQGQGEVPAGADRVFHNLHDWFVVGRPWRAPEGG